MNSISYDSKIPLRHTLRLLNRNYLMRVGQGIARANWINKDKTLDTHDIKKKKGVFIYHTMLINRKKKYSELATVLLDF